MYKKPSSSHGPWLPDLCYTNRAKFAKMFLHITFISDKNTDKLKGHSYTTKEVNRTFSCRTFTHENNLIVYVCVFNLILCLWYGPWFITWNCSVHSCVQCDSGVWVRGPSWHSDPDLNLGRSGPIPVPNLKTFKNSFLFLFFLHQVNTSNYIQQQRVWLELSKWVEYYPCSFFTFKQNVVVL